MSYNSQLGNTITPVLGLILSRYDDQEHREYNFNWGALDAVINGGVAFDGVAPIPGQVLTTIIANSQLGSAANYAILAGSGITNTGSSSVVTSGTIGSFPTATITGFNPPPAIVDSADASAAQTAAQAAYTYYSGLTFTPLGTNLSIGGIGGGNTYAPGNYSSTSSMTMPTGIVLTAPGTYIFKAVSTVNLASGQSVSFSGFATSSNTTVIWLVGSSFTSVATSNMVGTILAHTSVTLGGGTLNGQAIALTGAVTITAATTIIVPLKASWLTPAGGGGGVSSFNGRVGAVIPLTGDYSAFYDAFGAAATAQSNAETFATSQGFITVAALSGYALLSSPALSGTPTAPTAAPLTNNTQIATTAYVDAATGGSKFKTVRSTATSFTQGGVTGPIAMTFSSAFADNNYTVQVTVLGDEVAPGTPTVTQFPSVGVSYVAFQTIAGVGLNVWVSNNDSIPHTGHVHVAAWHD